MTKMAVVVAAAHAEIVVAVVTEAEADVGENKDSSRAGRQQSTKCSREQQ
jgi:hypothetical protein